MRKDRQKKGKIEMMGGEEVEMGDRVLAMEATGTV